MFYSFYVYVLSQWLKQRRLEGVPVWRDELLEAVYTAVRFTSSPSAWAHVFSIVTSSNGVAINKTPPGVKLKDEIFHTMKEKKFHTNGSCHYLSFMH